MAHAHVISCLHTRHYTYENTHTHTIGGDNAVAACASWPAVALRSIEPLGPIRSVASLVAVTRTRQSVRARHLVRAKHQIRHLLRARPKQRHLERYILMPRLSFQTFSALAVRPAATLMVNYMLNHMPNYMLNSCSSAQRTMHIHLSPSVSSARSHDHTGHTGHTLGARQRQEHP